ncbi:MAG: NAD-glutamate dehydrogenase, partial [Thermoanaerobaculia bacterium]|nr:NAD-glutamate dehydrogenase [Thermoanaerobaculia bacterium]
MWSEGHRAAIARIDQMLEQIGEAGTVDLAVLTVGERELRVWPGVTR